jgi:hypothetical protein
MKKLLIASAVSAAFAAPAVALAQAARAPTIGQVLDASGISVNGYIDAAYSYANKNIEAGIAGSGGTAFPRAFDNQNSSFALHQFGLTVAKQPSQGYGGVINITAGSDAQLIHSFPEGASTNTFDLTQAYGQYASGSLTLMAGKFTTLAGTEVIASTGNMNFSRSILFTAVPLTHTGVRAGYALSDVVTFYGGVNNGWDQLTDANRSKTLELGASIVPMKPLTINVSGYFGKEATGVGAAQDQRSLLNVTGNYVINRTMSVGAELVYVSQDRPAGGTAKYNGLAGYFTYGLNSQWRVAARAEMFDDKQGFHFATGTGTKYNEVTATLAYLPNSSVELRGEVRADKANNSVFIDSNGSTSKTLQTFALQGIYKF